MAKPGVERYACLVSQIDQGSFVLADNMAHAPSLFFHFHPFYPAGKITTCLLLLEAFSRDTVRKPVQGERSILEMG